MNATSNPSARYGMSPWQFGVLLALLVLAAYPQVVFGLETFVARDYGFFAYPLAYFQKQCFWRGELPFWNPYNDCGVPFLAQWNTMPLYPPSLLYLLFPLTWALSFFSLLHLWFAGLGMFFLARRWTGNSFAAAFAGAGFAFNGFTLNLLMWPSHIATFSWLPWVVLAVEAAWREGGKKLPVAAGVGAMQMLAGGPETIFLTWLVVSAIWLQQFIAGGIPRTRMLWSYPLVVLLVFALSAAQLLPFLDLVAHAQRETGYTDFRWSLPSTGLANFLVPMAFGSTVTEGIFFQRGQYWTSSYYLGIGTVWLAILAVMGLIDRWRSCIAERSFLLTVLAMLALLCAFGAHTPFYPALRTLVPQLSFITYPVKFIMLVVFASPLLAAFTLANLESSRKRLLPVGFVLFLFIGGILVWTRQAGVPGDDLHAALLNGFSRKGFLVLTGLVLFAMTRTVNPSFVRVLPLMLILVGWFDVSTHEPNQNPTAPNSVYQPNLASARLAMKPQPELGSSRVMLSPAAALELTRFAVSDPKNNLLAKRVGYCANANLLDGVPKVDGFFSLTPREFDGLLSFVYSVTNGNWSGFESFLGVSQYTSSTNVLAWQPRPGFMPLVTAGQQPAFLDDPNVLYRFGQNSVDPVTTVCLPPNTKLSAPIPSETKAMVRDVTVAANTVDFSVDAVTPSLAVVAQTYYHNWHAEMDGQPSPLLRANMAFQAVEVPAGRHHIHLFYRDRAFELGAAISLCMWVNCLVGYLALRRRELPPTPWPKNGDYF